MDKICVYTCITGNYDNLIEIKNVEKNIDYYCFTNNKNVKSKTWKIIYIEDNDLSDVKLARKIKILGHPIINKKYDILLWMDGAVVFQKPITDFIKKYLKKEDVFACFKHGERDNIKDEAKACIKLKKESKENVKRILDFYKKENYSFDNGLIESTVYIKRPKDKLVEKTMELWFDMILNYTKRDQLSFNYCIYKTGLKVKWINKKVFHNEWFSCNIHNYEKEISSYRIYFNDINNSEYEMSNDFQGSFKKNNNKYEISIKVPCDTQKTIIELSRLPFIMLKKIEISGIKELDAFYHNATNYHNFKVFYNENGAIEFYNKLKKGTKIKISLELEQLQLVDIVELLTEKQQIINKLETSGNSLELKNMELERENEYLKEKNEITQNELNAILNRKMYKIIRQFDKIRRKRR